MNIETYFIIIENRHYRHEYDNDDFHLEKVFSKEEILEIIKKNVNEYFDNRDLLIITNDKELLTKFLVCINIDEFKMLCRIKNFEEKNIRINKSYFPNFSEQVFEYFSKIQENEIISASMSWSHSTSYPYDDTSIGIDSTDYEGWAENNEFSYFKTPFRYQKENSENEIFYLNDVRKGNIEIFKNLININILDIGNDENPNINWEFRNNYLRYYDKISCKRLYITQELLNSLKANNNLEFNVVTKLDKNHYIEYYITGIFKEYDGDDDDDDFDREDNSSRFTKYNGAYGFDDNTIDSAFEGDPENYWNID